MTSQTRAAESGFPSGIEEWRTVLGIAGIILVRLLLLITAVGLLAFVRASAGLQFQAAALAAALGAIYLALGRDALIWTTYIAGFALFVQLRSYADNLGMPVQYEYPIVLEKLVFFGTIPTIWLQSRLYTFAHVGPLEFYSVSVYLSYFFVPHAVALALWKWDRERFKRYALGFLITLYIGLVCSAIVPTAPPWLAGQTGGIPHVFQVITDIAGEVTPGAYNNAYEVAGANPVAAMPSLHAAVPWLIAIALWRYRWFRIPALVYALSMSFAVVYLGEHYAVDSMAGLAAAAAGWALAGAWWRRKERAAERRALAAAGAPAPAVARAEPH